MQPLDLREDPPQQPAASHESGNAPALHVLRGKGDETLRRRVPRAFRFLTEADLRFEPCVSVHELGGQAGNLEVRLNANQDLVGLKGLRDVVHGAAAKSAQQALGVVLCRHNRTGMRASRRRP